MSKRQELEARRDALRAACDEAWSKYCSLLTELDRLEEQLNRLDCQELPPVKVGDRVFINGQGTTATWHTWATVRSLGEKWVHVAVDGDYALLSPYEKTRKVLRREILLVNPTEPTWLHEEGQYGGSGVDYYVADGFVAWLSALPSGDEHEAALSIDHGAAWEERKRVASGTREQMKQRAEAAYREWVNGQEEGRR